MLHSLGSRLWMSSVILTLVVVVLGFAMGAPPGLIGVITLVLLAGGFFIAQSTSTTMRRLRKEINEFVSTPTTCLPPDLPSEVQPLLRTILDLDAELRRTLVSLDQSLSEEREWNEAYGRSVVALQSDATMASRLNVFIPVLLRQARMDAGGYFAFVGQGEQRTPEMVAWVGPGPALPQGGLSPTRLERELAAGHLVWIENLTPGTLPPSLHTYASAHGFDSCILSPAVIEGEPLLGYLILLGKTSRARDARVAQYLELLRVPIAISQKNVMRLDSAIRDEKSTRIINDLLLAVGRSVGTREATRRILECVGQIQPFSRGVLLLVGGGDFYEVVDPMSADEGGPFLGTRLSREGTCATSAVVGRRVRIDEDFRRSPVADEDASLIREGYVSRMVVPLVVGIRPIGCLYLVSRSPSAFDPPTAETLRIALQGVATALDASRFHATEDTDGVADLTQLKAARSLLFELRIQLTRFMGRAASTLEQHIDGLPAPVVNTLGDIVHRTDHMLESVDGLCGSLGIDAGNQELHLDRFFLHDALRDVADHAAPLLQRHGVRLDMEDPRGMAPVIADEDQFHLLISTLVEASAEAMPLGGGVIQLSCSRVTARDLAPKLRTALRNVSGAPQGNESDILVVDLLDSGTPLPAGLLDPPGRHADESEPSDAERRLRRAARIARRHGGLVQVERDPHGPGNHVRVVLPQANVRRIGFVNHLGRRLKSARQSLSYLSLVSTGLRDRVALRARLGEEAFEEVMKELEAACLQAVRGPIDGVQRFDDAGLLVVFADTDGNGARRIAERVHDRLRGFRPARLPSEPVLEIGVLTYPEDVLRGEDVLRCLEEGPVT